LDSYLTLKDDENLFIVDLESVSFLTQDTVSNISSDDKRYYKTPFLYLVSSYSRNQAISWANKKYSYIGKNKKGFWMIYKFKKVGN